jgi:hypothetical protein
VASWKVLESITRSKLPRSTWNVERLRWLRASTYLPAVAPIFPILELITPAPSIDLGQTTTHFRITAPAAVASAAPSTALFGSTPPAPPIDHNLRQPPCRSPTGDLFEEVNRRVALIWSTTPNMAHLMGSVLFLVHIVASLAAPTSPRANGSDPQVGERWFGVREDFEIRPQDARAWPACADGSRTVPYCFGDVDTYQELSEVFAMGLAIWAPAMRVSSLAFAPDPACVQEPCLCSEPGVGEETLHIMLDPGRVAAASSLGYDPLFRDPNQPTHRLLWPANRAFTSHSAAPVLMAHELGGYMREQLYMF